jgi:DNA adenine methylase
MSQLIRDNDLERKPYAEPFAGGGGLALGLLFKGIVSELHLNDLDPAIWSFWNSILNHSDEFCQRIVSTEVTVDEWKRQREIILDDSIKEPLILGFAAFFLNRTSRSGIIKGSGVIGGLQQSGNYLIHCRYNKKPLIERIQRIAKYKSRIHLYGIDAIDFIQHFDANVSKKSLLCIDPPYFNQGSSLYTNFYVKSDHAKLSKVIASLERPWVVTYDNYPEIQELYDGFNQYGFAVNYSVQLKRAANELLVASDGMRVEAKHFFPIPA